MNDNTFITYLALGVVLMTSTLIFGFPDRGTENTRTPPPKDSFEISKISIDNLVGIWQDSGSMGSGWSDHISFFVDGKYRYFTNSMDCARRKLEEAGEWSLAEDKLILTKLSEINLTGGEMVPATGSCLDGNELKGAKEEKSVLPEPEIEELYIKRLPREEYDNYNSILMTSPGGHSIRFWKFSEDPTFGNEFPE